METGSGYGALGWSPSMAGGRWYCLKLDILLLYLGGIDYAVETGYFYGALGGSPTLGVTGIAWHMIF